MRFNLRALALVNIRVDGGTQVRDQLDEAWVSELVELYRDGHEIEPVLVVVETVGAEERLWLADGFHRVEAQRRLGCSAVKATVRTGPAATLDMAKMLAAAANKNGRPLQPGEKARAVRLARSTPAGAAMGVRELARHCGVVASYVTKIEAGACSLVNTATATSNRSAASTRARAAQYADLYQRVDAALQADPGKADARVAEEVDCDTGVVHRRREALGLPKSDPTRWKAHPEHEKAEAILRDHPEWSNRKIAAESGSGPDTVAKLRPKLGLPTLPRGPRPPSAPTRKGGDPRDGAEVIQARPAAASYSSTAVRDVAAMALRFSEPDWTLMLAQRAA